MAFTFGTGYTPVEASSGLDVGDYRAKIVNLTVDHYNNGNQFLNVVVEIEGHAGCLPNTIVLNDRPVLGTVKASGYAVEDKDVEKWDKAMTRFFDSFGINRGDFNMKNWQNKVGTVHCDWQYDPTEDDKKSKKYKQLTPIVRKGNAPSVAPSTEAKVSVAPSPSATPSTPATPSVDPSVESAFDVF